MTTYKWNHAVRMSAEFYLSGVLTNPTTVTLSIDSPSGSVITITDATNDSTGKYHYDYTPPIAGSYQYQFDGTGAVVAAAEGSFSVSPKSSMD